MRVWEVHVSHKSSAPLPPPLSWWITSSCVEGEEKAAEERPSYLICEWVCCLWSISWWKCLPERGVIMSDGEQHRSDSVQRGRHVWECQLWPFTLQISFTQNFFFFSKIRFVTYILLTRAVPHTWFWPGYPHIHRWDGGGVLVEMEGDGGTARDQSCQEHAKMRERCHRSPLLCHSSAYNEKIWADKGRRQTSVTAGGCQSVLKFKTGTLIQSNLVRFKKNWLPLASCFLPVKSKQRYSFII